jgi:hypothetical protein
VNRPPGADRPPRDQLMLPFVAHASEPVRRL